MKNKSAKNWLGVAVGSAMAMSAPVAQSALLFAETESNDTFLTANAFNPNNVDSPWGAIGDASAASNDVDIWSFTLGAGHSIAAEISYIGEYNKFDVNPVMTLFWENAGSFYSVASASATSIPSMAASTGSSSLGFTAWATGNYFLAITADFNQGVDAFGNFANTPGFQTTEDVLGTAFNNFNGASFTSFKYDVVTSTVVPVPAAVWLFGSGLLGLVGVARRNQKA